MRKIRGVQLLLAGLLLLSPTLTDAIVSAIFERKVLGLDGKHYMEITNSHALNRIDRQITIEAKFKVRTFTNEWMLLVYKGDARDTSHASYALGINRAGYVGFLSVSSEHTEQLVVSPRGSVRHNEWYHIAGVVDGNSHRMLLYLDGKVVGEAAHSQRIRKSAYSLRIGWNPESDPRFGLFKGTIDELRIWNIARSQQAIQRTADRSLSGTEDGLMGYWNFDDENTKDRSPNRLDGTIWERSDQSGQWSDATDLGGLTTADGKRLKRGMVNMSASYMHKGLPQAVAEGKMRTLIDYHAHWEIERFGWKRPDGTNELKVVHLPFGWTEDQQKWAHDWGRDSTGVFRLIMREHNEPIRETFKVLADPQNYPVIYYCRGALHRSKLMASMIYLAVGIPDEQVKDRLDLEHHLNQAMFDEIKRSGGINGYLKGIGVSAEEIEKVKTNLLE